MIVWTDEAQSELYNFLISFRDIHIYIDSVATAGEGRDFEYWTIGTPRLIFLVAY